MTLGERVFRHRDELMSGGSKSFPLTVQAGHGLQNKPDTWFTPQGGGLMPGRSSGQDKEAVVQGPERRTPGGASLRILPALGAFIACAAWGRYAKRHVGGSGPEAGHQLPRPRHGLLAGQGRNVNHVPGLKCKGCARFVPHPSPLPPGERVLRSRNCQRISEHVQGEERPGLTILVA